MSAESLNFTADKSKKPPFKLCFAKHQETGRSDNYFNKVNGNFSFLSSLPQKHFQNIQ